MHKFEIIRLKLVRSLDKTNFYNCLLIKVKMGIIITKYVRSMNLRTLTVVGRSSDNDMN